MPDALLRRAESKQHRNVYFCCVSECTLTISPFSFVYFVYGKEKDTKEGETMVEGFER